MKGENLKKDFGIKVNKVLTDFSAMTTDEMLVEIASYKYKSYGFPYVFLDFSQSSMKWEITWRNPSEFGNGNLSGKTPKEACENALRFILENSNLFSKH